MKRRFDQVGTASGVFNRNAVVRYGGRGVVARPFKRVRTQGGRIVPYGNTTYVVPNSLRSGARYVKKGVDIPIPEAVVENNMSNNSNIHTVNILAAGTGSWNRIGRVIDMKSVRIRAKISCQWMVSPYPGGTVAQPPNILDSRSLRIALVYDKQPNGDLPIKSQIFQYKNFAGTETGDWNGFLSYDNMERFIILRDETWTFRPPPLTMINQYDFTQNPPKLIQAGYPPLIQEECIDIYQRLNLRTNYKAESQNPSISDISTGALYVIYLTEPPLPNISPVISVAGVARLRYVDQ